MDRFLDTNTDRCLHLCGNLCRKLIAGDDTFIKLFSAERLRQFSRVQLNFHDHDQQGLNVELFLALVDRYQLAGLKWIVPVGDENIPAVQQMKRMGLDVVVLFDDSRGAGISPQGWRAPLTEVSCGYSGGLGPHNLATELPRIRSVVPTNYPMWVDMERRVRSGEDDTFDLSKVQASIDHAKRFKENR